MDKIDSRTLSVVALNERRRRAVKMRLDGTSLKDTAALCEMSRTTVIEAVKAHAVGGWKAVDIDRPGRPTGTGRTLSAEQEREVQKLIRDRTPDQLKMVYALWTRTAVAEEPSAAERLRFLTRSGTALSAARGPWVSIPRQSRGL